MWELSTIRFPPLPKVFTAMTFFRPGSASCCSTRSIPMVRAFSARKSLMPASLPSVDGKDTIFFSN